MQSFSRIVLSILVLTGILFFSSCYKIFDYVKQHPGGEVKACRVTALSMGTDTVHISYNSAGDPTDMIRNNTLHWQGDRHFRYNTNHQIRDYYWASTFSSSRLIWHRYSYPSKSIVIDSLFAYISDGNGPNPPIQNFNGRSIDSLDNQGRIVKITYPYPDPVIQHFSYDAKGNQQHPNTTYDSKLSIYRTNRVWMFLMNDYSVNNNLNPHSSTLQISDYNEAGLPLNFIPVNISSDILFVTLNSVMQVSYECK